MMNEYAQIPRVRFPVKFLANLYNKSTAHSQEIEGSKRDIDSGDSNWSRRLLRYLQGADVKVCLCRDNGGVTSI